jgi:hypothetical protein
MGSRPTSDLHGHAIAIAALVCSVLALAGASYAATSLPESSPGAKQLEHQAVRLARPQSAVPLCNAALGAYPLPPGMYARQVSGTVVGITSIGT